MTLDTEIMTVHENYSIQEVANNLLWDARNSLSNVKTVSMPIAKLSTLGAGVSSLVPVFDTFTQTTSVSGTGLYKLANAGVGDALKVAKNSNFWGAFKAADVIIVGNLLAMARGGITIEDNVMIAANVQLISNNHDPYDRAILPCKPVLIKKGAWIGAGATVLPGVCVGRYVIVGAASVVTKDVPDYAVVVRNPAKVIKTLDAERCEAQNG